MSAEWCCEVQKVIESVNSSPFHMTCEGSVDLSLSFLWQRTWPHLCAVVLGDSWSHLKVFSYFYIEWFRNL